MNINPRISLSVGQLFYLAALAFYVWTRVIELSLYIAEFSSAFIEVTGRITIALVLISIVLQGFTWASAAASAAVILLGYISFLSSGELFILVLAALIVGAKNVTFRQIASVVLIVVVLTSVYVLLSCAAGQIENHVWDQGGRSRNGLGFRYPLFPSNLYFYSVLLLVWLCRARIKIWVVLLLGLGAVGFYLATDSRLALVLSLLALALNFVPARVWQHFRSGGRILATVAALFYPLIAAFAIALAFTGTAENPFLIQLNRFIGNRIAFMARSLEIHGDSLFGTPTYFLGNGLGPDGKFGSGEYTFIDNSFVNMFVRFGWVPTAVILLGMATIMWVLVRKGNWLTVTMLVLVGLHASIDSWFLYVELNTFILMLGTHLLKQIDHERKDLPATTALRPQHLT